MKTNLRGVAATLRSTTRLVTEPFHALHLVPVHGIRTGTDFEQAEAASPNLGQRFTGGIDQLTFQISLGHSKNLSGSGECAQHRLESKQVRVMQSASRTQQLVDRIDARKPAGGEPRLLGGKSFGPMVEGTEYRAVDGREIGGPMTVGRRFDVAGTANIERTECGQLDRLVVDAADDAADLNDELH